MQSNRRQLCTPQSCWMLGKFSSTCWLHTKPKDDSRTRERYNYQDTSGIFRVKVDKVI